MRVAGYGTEWFIAKPCLALSSMPYYIPVTLTNNDFLCIILRHTYYSCITQFAAQYVDINYQEYVCLVHDPRHETMCTYTVDCLQNVYGGPPVTYLNIPIQSMKKITQNILQSGTPVVSIG